MFKGGLKATDGGIDARPSSSLDAAVLPSSATSAVQSPSCAEGETVVRIRAHRVSPSRLGVITSRASVLRRSRDGWSRRYHASLVVIDLLAASAASVLAFFIRFSGSDQGKGLPVDRIFALVMPLVWIVVIAVNGAYEARFVGVGTAEFERVFRAFMHLVVLTAFMSYAAQVQLARGYILMALPLALVLDLEGRYIARKCLHRRRAHGKSMKSVLAVGGPASVAEFTALLRHDRHAGMRVVGACVPVTVAEDPDAGAALASIGVQLLGDVDTILASARKCGADAVAVLSGEIRADKLRWISWQLEGTEIDLVVSPGLTEVGGRRLHIQPVAGLPMLHIEQPDFRGFRRVLKAVFDRTAATVAVLALSPVLLAIAIAVRLDTRGAALFRQVRVGIDGKTFTLFKFRSMCVDAEDRLSSLSASNENADGLLFKIKADPRVTRVGAVIRRYSLDELPQLINVIKGDMSLVGPRPPLPNEVAAYADDVRRRLLVKPGITGIWQVSGRSDLSWEESVRLDLRYVENWSLATDLMILWKTAFAVVRTSGAY